MTAAGEFIVLEAATRTCSVKTVFLKFRQHSRENTYARVFIQKETLAQVFSCEFCDILNFVLLNIF